jgi:small-conductance mechanosensitive channel
MFIEEVVTTDLLIAGAIVIFFLALAWVFYYIIRRLLRRLSMKTGTVLDDLMIRAMEWPVFTTIILSGVYFASTFLPLTVDFDFEVSRGLRLVFIILGAWALGAVIDALFHWFKLEVTSKTNTPVDDWITLFIRVVSPIIIAAITITVSMPLYDIDTETLKNWLLDYGIQIGIVLVVSITALFILGITGSRMITAIVAQRPTGQSDEEVKKRANTLSSVILTTGQVLIILIAVLVILSEFVNITPALAGAGVVGVAVGLGAQGLIKDLIAGFFIVMENQYRVGDIVNIAGIGGLVEDINLRRTVVRDMNGVVHTVPNSEIKVASNLTKEYSRVNLDISVSYETDLDHATKVINRVCKELADDPKWASMIIKTPQVLRVEKLGDSGIDLKIFGDTRPTRQWDVASEIRKRVKKAFDQEGIEIPWPHTKVFFGNSPDNRDSQTKSS